MNADDCAGDILSTPTRTKVEHSIAVKIVATDEGVHNAYGRAVLGCDPADACAVTLTVHDGPKWVFDRNLLAWGLKGVTPAVGDVLVFPTRQPNTLMVKLTSGRQWAALELDSLSVTSFLEATCRSVPPGTEFDWVDWDMVVAGWSA